MTRSAVLYCFPVNKPFLMLSLTALAALSYADLRSDITAARQKQEKAAKAKDIKGVEAAMKESLTPDFKYVQDGKTQDAKTYTKEFVDTLRMTEKVASSSSRIISLKESGNKGSAEIELHMTGTMRNPDKPIHTINWTGLFTEEYRKVDGKWKTAKMTAGKQKFLMDGKPVKM